MVKTKTKHTTIENYLREIISRLGKAEWLDKNSCNIVKRGKVIGRVVLNDTEMITSGKEVKDIHKEFIEREKEAERNKLTPENVKKTSLKHIFTKEPQFNGLLGNPFVFKKLDKALTDFGIKEVIIDKEFSASSSISKTLTLALDCYPKEECLETSPSGYITRLRNILYENYITDSHNKNNLILSAHANSLLPFENEDVIEIKLCEMVIGRYYKERNLIYLSFNPFYIKKTLPMDTDFHKIFKDLIKLFRDLKIKKVKTENLKEKMFISSFLMGARKNLVNLMNSMKEQETSIGALERDIRLRIDKVNNINQDYKFIETTIKMGGKNMLEEIEKTKKLSFLKNVEMNGDNIKLTFIPATIKVNAFTKTDHGKSYGKRTFYLGNITINISPRNFIVRNDIRIRNNPHPHASSNEGAPCFGSGEGRNRIYELLAVNKFSEVSKLLWFWIKTYINNGAHVKQWDAYDSLLSQGYPVWDENGKRIELNEPTRMDSGEQRRLDKSENYEANIKKFANTKIF